MNNPSRACLAGEVTHRAIWHNSPAFARTSSATMAFALPDLDATVDWLLRVTDGRRQIIAKYDDRLDFVMQHYRRMPGMPMPHSALEWCEFVRFGKAVRAKLEITKETHVPPSEPA